MIDSSLPLLESDEEEHNLNITIPEIPPIPGDGNGDGRNIALMGRGFTMLQAVATSYVPVMEQWFEDMMAVVPQDSECLTNFLWEPLSNEQSQLKCKSCPSLATLGSIQEQDCFGEEGEDDW